MSVYRRGGVFWYDFQFKGKRYRASTGQRNAEDARLVESQKQLKLRRQSAGIDIIDASRSPRIQDWAETYYLVAAPKVTHPERIAALTRCVLRFWGQRNPKNDKPHDPYHDLRLLDPILEPIWIERFEAWMASKGISGQTKNHYRSAMSRMYALASKAAYRKTTGVQVNPFAGLDRDVTPERTVTLSVLDMRAWMQHAAYHVRLAMAIAALAPKLRLRNVLDLTWKEHFDKRLERIVIQSHKTAHRTGRPLVQPVNEQLQRILVDAKARSKYDYVITYQSKPLHSIRGGLKLAAERAGLTYGRLDGITFHTIRHTMATMLAELGEGESLRKDVMGHASLETTQRYTHIRPQHQIAALERLSAATPIEDLVTLPTVGTFVQHPTETPRNPKAKQAVTRRRSGDLKMAKLSRSLALARK